MTHKILVTGASSGFGTLIVHALLAEGHAVAGSMRDPDGRNASAAKALRDAGASVVAIDVTDDASVDAGVQAAVKALGGLTVLVNNAGIGVSGLIEAFTPQDFQRVFDVNVFGVQRMNRAVAPLFREQGHGLLLHISSLLGRIAVPFYGPYNATKWAVEAIAEGYRVELSAFGVEVALIEPGGYPTAFMDRLLRPSDAARTASYGPMADAPEQTLKGFHEMLLANPAQDPANVARAVVARVGAPAGEGPLRTVVDSLGMGVGVEALNQGLEQVTEAVYGNMGIAHMLTPKA